MKAAKRIAMAGLLMGALLMLSGCATAKPGAASDAGDLTGVEWTLSSASVSSADLGAAGITATFDGTKVSGFSGVNQYSGPYTAGKDGSFKVGEIAGTLMAGEPAAMAAEQAYLAALATCDTYKVADGKLTLFTGKQETLVYEQAKAVELPGSKWIVTNYNNGKQAVVGVAAESTMTMEFGTDGNLSGNGGVNTYNGAFKADGATIAMGPFMSTKMAGPEPLMAQEQAFLKALENGTKWTVSRGMLEIRDGSDALQVIAKQQ
jgi:heat shock protein HslJ